MRHEGSCLRVSVKVHVCERGVSVDVMRGCGSMPECGNLSVRECVSERVRHVCD